MFLECYSTNEYVWDFQIIYDTDNILHVDFYADGLLLEPIVLFDSKTHYKKAGYGLIKTNITEHDKYEELFNQKINDKQYVEEISKNMIKTIIKLHKNCLIIEKNISNININILEDFYYSICEVMAYRRFVDKVQQNIDLVSINNSKVKSYILRLNEQLNKVANNKIDLESFIWRYGFLFDFNIEKTKLELEDELIKYVINNKFLSPKIKTSRNSNYDIVSKRLCWHEEFRHYYQLRALRNFRIIFENNGLDIYTTCFDDLKRKLCKDD